MDATPAENVDGTRPSGSAPQRGQARGLFVVLAVLMIILLALSLRAVQRRSGVYAYVDDTPIRKPMVDLAKELLLRNQGQMPPTPEQEFAALAAAVTQAVERELVSREARRRGIEPSEELLQDNYESLIHGIAQWMPPEEMLRVFRVGEDDLWAEVEKDVLYSMLRQEILDGVPPVTEEDARKFYNERIDLFEERQATRLYAIFVRKPDNAEGLQEARARIEEAREEILAGTDFRAVAARVSEDARRSQGGDLGWVKDGFLPDVMQEEAARLQTGEVSEILETRDGYHLLKVEGRRSYGYTPFSEVKTQIRVRLKLEASEREFRKLVNRLRSQARIVRYDGEYAVD